MCYAIQKGLTCGFLFFKQRGEVTENLRKAKNYIQGNKTMSCYNMNIIFLKENYCMWKRFAFETHYCFAELETLIGQPQKLIDNAKKVSSLASIFSSQEFCQTCLTLVFFYSTCFMHSLRVSWKVFKICHAVQSQCHQTKMK